MVVRKCDICGSVIHKTTPKYRVIFDGWLYTERKDICVSCFERIREEIKQADTPQTETKTETENSNLAFELVNDSQGLVNKGLVKYTPPTDGVEWEDYVPFKVKEPLNHVGIIRGETDCAWK